MGCVGSIVRDRIRLLINKFDKLLLHVSLTHKVTLNCVIMNDMLLDI